jgi:hypothetical protein
MTRRLGTSTALVGLLAAALSTVGTPSSTAADPMLGAPAVGQCFDMGREELELAAHPEAPVDCAVPHTAQTVAVTTMPDGLAYEDDKGLLRFALETCYPAQRTALRTNALGARLTAYSIGFFGPTPEQQAAGARWLRCDLVLTHDQELLPLPDTLRLGRFPFADKVSRCLAGRDFHVAVCSEPHTYRATAAMKVKLRKYPSTREWKRIGTQRCRRATTSRTYRFSWSSKDAWRAGDKALVCYTKTRR